MYYVLDENNNKVEAFDKEGVLNALETAIANGSLESLVADAGFISKLKCCVSGQTNNIAFVTQAKYNELCATNGLLSNCLYIITDETTSEDINAKLAEFEKYLNGVPVPKAAEAENYTRVYSVNLNYANEDADATITCKFRNVAFNWFTNRDIEPTIGAVIDDIVDKIGTQNADLSYTAVLPCSGMGLKGIILTNVTDLQHISKVEFKKLYSGRYNVRFVYLDQTAIFDSCLVDDEKLTVTVTKLN